MSLNLHNAEFLTSAVDPKGYPVHDRKEIALVGRSNVGKSSLINTLVNRKKFARTSNQPGRTQTLNFYRVDTICLVDLPGYGFAKVPESVRKKWRPMIETYLMGRPNLVGVLHLVDVRHTPTADDQTMSQWLQTMDMPYVLIATKLDKISRGSMDARPRSSVTRWAQHHFCFPHKQVREEARSYSQSSNLLMTPRRKSLF